jgi:hypothetical protein
VMTKFSYTEMRNYKKTEELDLLRNELCAQVESLNADDFKVKHLTNHHNSLTLFPHHFNIYMEVARKFRIPMRSTCIRPEKRQNLYLRFLNYKLRDNIHSLDRDQIRKFAGEIEAYFNANAKGVKAPQILDSRHYGPVSILPARLIEFLLVRQKRKGLDNLYELFRNASENTLELLFHIAKPSGFRADRGNDIDYPGVDRGYFDSRVIEFRSLMGYNLNEWDGVALRGWDLP